MVEIITNAAVVIPYTERRNVLLIRKDLGYKWNPGMWGFFGGKIEDGEPENGLESVARELVEEIGFTLPRLDFFKVHRYSDVAPSTGQSRRGNLYVYTGEFDGDLSKIKLREGAGFSLWDEKEIWSLHMVPHNKDVVMEFYRRKFKS